MMMMMMMIFQKQKFKEEEEEEEGYWDSWGKKQQQQQHHHHHHGKKTEKTKEGLQQLLPNWSFFFFLSMLQLSWKKPEQKTSICREHGGFKSRVSKIQKDTKRDRQTQTDRQTDLERDWFLEWRKRKLKKRRNGWSSWASTEQEGDHKY